MKYPSKAILAVLLISASLPALAVNRNWTGAAGNSDWFNAGNWSGTPAGVPGVGDSARLGVAATPVPSLWPNYNGDNTASQPSGAFTIGQAITASFTMSGGTFVQSAGTITIGNGGAGISGTWAHNGGSFTANASTMNIGQVTSASGSLTMNNGAITVNALNLANGASATASLTINEGLFYVNGTTVLNNSSKTGTSASILVADGGIFNGNKIDFNKGIMTIESGGLVRIRNVAQTVPLSIRSDNIIYFAGGDMYVGMNYTGLGTIEGWISGGRMVSTDPGKPVITYDWDSTSGFTHIYTIVPEPTGFALIGLGLGLFLIRRRS